MRMVQFWFSWFSLIVVSSVFNFSSCLSRSRSLCLVFPLSLWLINFYPLSWSIARLDDCFSAFFAAAVYQRFITLTFCQFDCF